MFQLSLKNVVRSTAIFMQHSQVKMAAKKMSIASTHHNSSTDHHHTCTYYYNPGTYNHNACTNHNYPSPNNNHCSSNHCSSHDYCWGHHARCSAGGKKRSIPPVARTQDEPRDKNANITHPGRR